VLHIFLRGALRNRPRRPQATGPNFCARSADFSRAIARKFLLSRLLLALALALVVFPRFHGRKGTPPLLLAREAAVAESAAVWRRMWPPASLPAKGKPFSN